MEPVSFSLITTAPAIIIGTSQLRSSPSPSPLPLSPDGAVQYQVIFSIMAPPEKLHEIYADQLAKRHDYGYPMYEPTSRSIIKPGVCGYIDSHGHWNPVANLNKPEELTQKGLTAPRESLEFAPDDYDISWGPKCSEAVRGRRLGTEAAAS